MKNQRRPAEPGNRRPTQMRIDEARCTECDACFDLAPVIRLDTQHIPVFPATLDAMAECPAGALVWREVPATDKVVDEAEK